MKGMSIVITGKENAELQKVEYSDVPAEDEIVGRTLYTLISPGTELAGGYCGNEFPVFPGYSAVACVEKIGRSVKDLREDDIFFCMGKHRDFQKVKESDAVAVPGSLLPEKAVLCRLMGVSMTTLMTTAARPGDNVIISGAGPVGFLASQIFHISGYNVIVTEPSIKRREAVIAAGGIKVFASVPFDLPGISDNVAMVVECSGNEQAVLDACKIVRRKGEVVMVGVPWKRCTEIYSHDILHAIFHKYVVLRSGWEWELPNHCEPFNPHSIFSGYRTSLEWLAQGRVFTEGLISIVYPKNVQNIYQQLLRGEFHGLFPVLKWC